MERRRSLKMQRRSGKCAWMGASIHLQRTHGSGGGGDIPEHDEALLLHTPRLLRNNVEDGSKLQTPHASSSQSQTPPPLPRPQSHLREYAVPARPMSLNGKNKAETISGAGRYIAWRSSSLRTLPFKLQTYMRKGVTQQRRMRCRERA